MPKKVYELKIGLLMRIHMLDKCVDTENFDLLLNFCWKQFFADLPQAYQVHKMYKWVKVQHISFLGNL
jgi:hypothetical protein